MDSKYKLFRRVLLAAGIFVLIAAIVFLAGPRVDTSYISKNTVLPDDLDGYLAHSEANVAGVVEGAEKKIFWANADKRKTPISVIYLHGFTATRQETAPLAQREASALGANLYCTRLTGHGIGGEALAKANLSDWLNDAREALSIGEKIGDKVIVIGCSTGGALTAWLTTQAPCGNVLACVLVSPNFWPKNKNAPLALWPWARQVLPRIHASQITGHPLNEQHARYWTIQYPMTAFFPMMALCKVGREQDYSSVTTPLLMIYCPEDKVVEVEAAKTVFAQWGGAVKKLVSFTPPESAERHVIAGDIRAPSGTQPLTEEILKFVSELR